MDGSSEAERLILRFDSASNLHALFDGSHPAQVERYLRAVEDVRRRGCSSGSWGILRLAMTKLEGEFENILVTRVPDLQADLLLSDLSSLSMAGSVDDRASLGGASSLRPGGKGFEGEDAEKEEEETAEDGEIRRTQTGTSSSRYGSTRNGSTDSLMEIDLVPSDVLYDLRSIAEQMLSAGYGNECFQVYGRVRKGAIGHCLEHLRIENLSIGDVHRLPWEDIELRIRRWIHAARVCFRLVFASERRLCDLVFDGLDDAATSKEASSDIAFAESVKPAAFQLLVFAEAISLGERTAERLFKIVELYDALRDLMPDIEAVFFCRSSSISRQAEEILSQLVDAVEGILFEFESAIRSHSSNKPMPGGAIHPMTSYVMNYVRYLSDFKVTLSELIVSKPCAVHNPSSPDLELTLDDDSRSPLSAHILYIISILASNLDCKAKVYKDDALSHIFVVNNLHYIVRKVRDSSDLRELVGDDFLRRLTGKYRQAATMYQREAWGKLIGGIRASTVLSRSAFRERFKSFNAAFEESHRTQSAWVVPDPQLKEELRISISARLVPAYNSFLGGCKQHIESERRPDFYVKYTIEELESAIGDLFEGDPSPQPARWKSRSSRLFSHFV